MVLNRYTLSLRILCEFPLKSPFMLRRHTIRSTNTKLFCDINFYKTNFMLSPSKCTPSVLGFLMDNIEFDIEWSSACLLNNQVIWRLHSSNADSVLRRFNSATYSAICCILPPAWQTIGSSLSAETSQTTNRTESRRLLPISDAHEKRPEVVGRLVGWLVGPAGRPAGRKYAVRRVTNLVKRDVGRWVKLRRWYISRKTADRWYTVTE